MAIRRLSGYQVSKEFYDLFFKRESKLSIREYLDNSYCDDVAIVNLKKNTYNLIYHVSGKYYTPVTNGTYTGLFTFAGESVVHPDDEEKYFRFFQEIEEYKELNAIYDH